MLGPQQMVNCAVQIHRRLQRSRFVRNLTSGGNALAVSTIEKGSQSCDSYSLFSIIHRRVKARVEGWMSDEGEEDSVSMV